MAVLSQHISFLLTKIGVWIVIIPFIIVVAWIFYGLLSKRQRYVPGVPIIGKGPNESLAYARERFRRHGKEMLCDGYRKHKGSPFYVPTPLGERLMLPPKYAEEVKNRPSEEFDFVGTFFEMFEGKYTTMGDRATIHPRVTKAQLNHHLGDVLPEIMREIVESFDMHMPPCEDWTEVQMAQRFVDMVARVTSRMFGGRRLSKNDEWVESTTKFAEDGFIGAQTIKSIPFVLRPLAAKFIPALRRIKLYHKRARDVIIPLLNEREETGEKPMDFLQWMTDSARPEEQSKEFLAIIQLKLSFAAIHTSAAAPMQLLYDLCAMPEYIEPLRQELETVLKEFGSLTKQALSKLKKLDSIMKESQRFNPILLITMERIVTRDCQLKDGFTIPKGTQVGVPAQAISMDPILYHDPETFDGFRFEKMGDQADVSGSQTQYVAANLQNMAFGYGRHACPGRFFAAAEIKMFVAYMLMNYDFRFPEGNVERPPSLPVETQYLPNHEAVVMMKRRPLEKR